MSTQEPEPAPAPHEKVNVLLVDDQPAKLLSYEAILADLGENLIRAESARQALDLLLKTDVAVILIDVCMPEFDGFDLVAMIRQHPRFDRTAIILVSAVFMSDVDRLRGYERGAMDYVSVPIVPEILRAKVAAFAELHRKTRQLERLNEDLELRVAERTRELQASAERLRASEERLSVAVAAGSVATWLWDLSADRVFGDDRLAFFFDVPPGEAARGTPLERVLAAVHEEDRPRVLTLLTRAGQGDAECVIECRVRSADHALHWIRGRGRVERDETGRPVRLPGAFVDVTEQRRMEEALRHDDRRKDEFLAMLAHELRNPLASVRNATRIMRVQTVDDPVLRWARDMIDRQVDQLARLVDDLLDVSRITEGKIKLRMEPVDLAGVVAESAESCRPLIAGHRHELTVRIMERPLWVDGDQVRLTQVVTNLLNNAAKYQAEGGRITLVLEREGEECLVRVRDEGMGIAPEMLSQVFDLFVQAESTLHRAKGGLGIGLSLVKRLAEMHGGSVRAFSGGAGHGSEFVVRLPRRQAPPEDVPAATPAAEEAPPSGTPLRILVVDDNCDAAESLTALLRHVGHQVFVAHDGVRA